MSPLYLLSTTLDLMVSQRDQLVRASLFISGDKQLGKSAMRKNPQSTDVERDSQTTRNFFVGFQHALLAWTTSDSTPPTFQWTTAKVVVVCPNACSECRFALCTPCMIGFLLHTLFVMSVCLLSKLPSVCFVLLF